MRLDRVGPSLTLVSFMLFGACTSRSDDTRSATDVPARTGDTGSRDPRDRPTALPQSQALQEALQKVRDDAGVRSISAVAWRGGALVAQAAVGVADARTNTPAKPDSIYMIASCSKPVVGLALALLMQDQPVDLDADINTWMKWDQPPRNPAHPTVPLTLRQLVTHRSSIASDGPDDYDTYARPDPNPDMDGYLRERLADPEMWEDFAPGSQEEYSNVATALAAYVIEKAAKQPFSAFCRERIFKPLGLRDTGWFFSDFDAGQVARMARPHDEAGAPLEHYGFPDWPSGQIRTTTGDLARLWMAIQSHAAPFTEPVLAGFESVTFFIQKDPARPVFDHSGGEVGVSAYFTDDHEGNGYAWLINHEVPDAAGEVLDEKLIGILRELSGLR